MAPATRWAAFVSLHVGGGLRGCIGQLEPSGPLGELVARLAVAAARHDPRFPPVSPDELADLTIEISVLRDIVPLQPRQAAAVAVGRHGLIVRRGGAEGLLLPQVATEHAWTAEDFLAAACRKAGLPPDAWREPDSEVLVFEAEIFGEGETGDE